MTDHKTREAAVLARFLQARGLTVEEHDGGATLRVPAEQEERFLAAMEQWTAHQTRKAERRGPRPQEDFDLLHIPRPR
jgi:hypothetical protein